jgi:hypothetical protein
MRFIDGDQRELRVVDELAKTIERRAFGRDVEQIELARVEALDGASLVTVGRRQRGRAHAERFGAADLVVHQRNQRRDDQRGAFADQRGQLITERFSGAGRHHCERVLPGENAADHLFLDAPEMVEAEGLFEDRVRVGHGLFKQMRTERAAEVVPA